MTTLTTGEKSTPSDAAFSVKYQNIGSMFFRFVMKHACDEQTDGQNYDSQDHATIAASRHSCGKTGKIFILHNPGVLQTDDIL